MDQSWFAGIAHSGGVQERFAGRRKSAFVAARDLIDRDRRKVGQTGGRRAAAPAPLTDVAEGEPEARFAVVLLLGDDAVEADHAVAEMVERGAPEGKAEAPSAALRRNDVEPQEPEARAVADRRHAADRAPVEFAEKEPLRVGGVEAMRVIEAGIPALRRGPIERAVQIGFGHPAQNEPPVGHRILSLSSVSPPPHPRP